MSPGRVGSGSMMAERYRDGKVRCALLSIDNIQVYSRFRVRTWDGRLPAVGWASLRCRQKWVPGGERITSTKGSITSKTGSI